VAIGTITSVEMLGRALSGKNRPGKIKFSDGIEVSTFNEALLAMANNGRGQLAEYVFTEKQNGRFTNRYLESLTLKGAASYGASPAQTARPDVERLNGGFAAVAEIESAINRLGGALKEQTAAIRELTSTLGRAGSARGIASPAGSPTQDAQAPETLSPVVDPLVAAEAALAKAVESPEAARAMFEAIKAKFTNKAGVLDVEKALTQARKTLAGHGVEI
jgi:hypothetical protein